MTTPREARARRRAEQAAKQRKRSEQAGDMTVPSEATVDVKALAPSNSYGEPDFVRRGSYVDRPFTCIDCGVEEVWTAAQQKWWYEVAKGDVFTGAVRCRDCRAKERLRRDDARRVHFDGILKKYGSLERVLPKPQPPASVDETSSADTTQDSSAAPRGKGNARRRRKLGRKPPPDWKPDAALDPP